VQTAAVFKALSDTNRLRALAALVEQPLCVCQIVELLALAPSTVSKHMSVLAGAGLVESEKRGRWVYYRLGRHTEGSPRAQLTAVLANLLAAEPRVGEDHARLATILETDPEVLCRAQARGEALVPMDTAS